MSIEEMFIALCSRYKVSIDECGPACAVNLWNIYGYVGTYYGKTLEIALRNAIAMTMG